MHAEWQNCREEDEARERNKEHYDMEAARIASLADEKARRMEVVESAVSAQDQDMWRPWEELFIVLFLMKTQLRVSRLQS